MSKNVEWLILDRVRPSTVVYSLVLETHVGQTKEPSAAKIVGKDGRALGKFRSSVLLEMKR
jgi:hypothetical protein